MKKFLTVFLAFCMLISAFPAIAAEAEIELYPLQYDEYMRGETLVITGYTNTYVTLGLYYPPEAGGTLKYSLIYSPGELSDGIELEIGETRDWPYGEWTVIVQSGEVSDTLTFTLSETVNRTEEPETEPDTKPNTTPSKGNSSTSTVTSIVPDKTNISLTEGESTTVKITSSASSFTVEVEDKSVVSASLSGKTLTVTAIEKGTSQIWIKSGSNYASVNVNVDAKEEAPTEAPTENVIEEPEGKQENPFDDIENHWAKDSIITLYNKGVINGMGEHTFAPDEYVTRAQFVTMLCNAFGFKAKSASSPFNDVSEDDWYFASVMAAYETGITKGDNFGNFNPSSLVTRQDMAVFAHRAAVNTGKTFILSNISTFSDHNSISDYAVEAVYAMKSGSVINGMTETTFVPLGSATRAQAAHIIAKLLEY